MKYFSTSMMCANMFTLQETFKTIDEHTDIYHIDVMDGHFVPNLALSFDFVKQLRAQTKKPIDCHLMMTNPGEFIDGLIDIKVDYISLHPKTIEREVFRIIKKLQTNHIKFGIALSPSDGLETLNYYKDHIDKITVMTVEPGFAGQSVIEEMISKIKEVYAYREQHNLDFLIEIDGSNNYNTFEKYYQNGADVFILGSTLFKERDLDKSFKNIKSHIEALSE